MDISLSASIAHSDQEKIKDIVLMENALNSEWMIHHQVVYFSITLIHPGLKEVCHQAIGPKDISSCTTIKIIVKMFLMTIYVI
jgi:hypothetical protein